MYGTYLQGLFSKIDNLKIIKLFDLKCMSFSHILSHLISSFLSNDSLVWVYLNVIILKDILNRALRLSEFFNESRLLSGVHDKRETCSNCFLGYLKWLIRYVSYLFF